MDTPSGVKDSIPAWINYSLQLPDEIPYNGIYYDPPEEVTLFSLLLLIAYNIILYLVLHLKECGESYVARALKYVVAPVPDPPKNALLLENLTCIYQHFCRVRESKQHRVNLTSSW